MLSNPSSQEYKKAKRQFLKATRNRNSDIDTEWSPFRAAEKRYKARFPSPDLSNVLDLATLDTPRNDEIQKGLWVGRSDAIEYRKILLSDVSVESRKAYIVPRIPGLVILPSFVSPEKQRRLVHWSLSEHARHPNETNLDIHYFLPKEGLWNAWLDSGRNANDKYLIRPRALEAATTGLPLSGGPGPRQLVNNTPASSETFYSISSTPKPPPTPSHTVQPTSPSALIQKLRWANIGWYYHWGTKQYDFTKGKGNVDSEIKEICKAAVGMVAWQQVYGGDDADWGESEPSWMTWNETYEPDAGIVNFYQTKDTLMAHVDRSEVCATSPLVSISLGNAAVFLIGGLTRDVEPVPILLRSGDIVIMSGPACRRAYHGVPRILEGTLPPHLKSQGSYWDPYEEYMRTTRININVRQVFPRGFDPGVQAAP